MNKEKIIFFLILLLLLQKLDIWRSPEEFQDSTIFILKLHQVGKKHIIPFYRKE